MSRRPTLQRSVFEEQKQQQQQQQKISKKRKIVDLNELVDSKSDDPEEKEDLYSNVLITLRTLQLQNSQLLKFQERSYKWHLQHHENIKRIIDGLNIVSSNFERMNSGTHSFRVEPEENASLFSSSESDKRMSLHERILSFRKNGDQGGLLEALKAVDSISEFEELQDQSFEMVIPSLEILMDSNDPLDKKCACSFLIEGISHFPSVFTKPILKGSFAKMADSMERMDPSDLDIDPQQISQLYQYLRDLTMA